MQMDENRTPIILVLLSTYNGERYLKEQLDSLLTQEGVKVHILVRDDGSTDGTRMILTTYREKYPAIFSLIYGENMGWQRSFFELMIVAKEGFLPYDYYAFCDQDDIWLPRKLLRAVEQINILRTDIRLYCSNLYYYKDNINHGLIKTEGYLPTPENCLIRNFATGCTIIFNQELLDVVVMRLPQREIPHDKWVYQVAVLLGSVYVDKKAYIMYRQHMGNQIGCKRNRKEIWSQRLKTLRSTTNQHVRELEARELINCFSDMLPLHCLKAVHKVAYYRNNLSSRLSLVFDRRYSTGLCSNDFWLRLRILVGKL